MSVLHNQSSSSLDIMKIMKRNAREKEATRASLVKNSLRDVSAQRG